jgi:hypothetical protein
MLLDAVDDGIKIRKKKKFVVMEFIYTFMVNGLAARKKGAKEATTMCS